MKSKQYFIATKDGKIAITGYPVVIPGYEEFEFFVHRPYAFGKLRKTGWRIAETTTGLCVSPRIYSSSMSNSTRAGALAIVIDALNVRGREYALPRIREAVEKAQA